MADPTQRFSNRASDYALYRPSYPVEVVALLERECGLRAGSRVADIGSGTGLLAERFLQAGCHVTGVEPNPEMRAAGDRILAGLSFRSVAARAEATGLPDGAFDFVTAGQAFHWFHPAAAHTEFKRILRPGGWLVLVWNERPPSTHAFQAGYQELVSRYAPEITRIQEDKIDLVYGGPVWRLDKFPNSQRLDLAGLQGRLSSSSYAPAPGTPEFTLMREALSRLFQQHQHHGAVTLLYETSVYWGRIV